MNHSIQLSELNGLRRTNSDGNLLLIKNEVNKKSYSEIVNLSYDYLEIDRRIQFGSTWSELCKERRYS